MEAYEVVLFLSFLFLLFTFESMATVVFRYIGIGREFFPSVLVIWIKKNVTTAALVGENFG